MKYEIYAQIRDQKGFKDGQVSAGTGVARSTFSDWKHGRSNPKIDKLEKIAKFLGVSVDFLQYGDTRIDTSEDLFDLDAEMKAKAEKYADADKYDQMIYLMEKFEKLPEDRKALVLRILETWGV